MAGWLVEIAHGAMNSLRVDSAMSADVSLTLDRVVFTVIGAILAVALAWGMERWDESSGLIATGTPT